MIKIFLLLFSLFLLQTLQAQLLFTTLKPANGLASRDTRAVYRDNEGYVWIGTTAGLNRFDGAHYKLWNKTTPGYPKDLGEVIITIIEHMGKIYIGTSEGIGILEKASGRLSQAVIKTTDNNTRFVTKLECDAAGRLWAATDKGLVVESGNGFVPASEMYPSTGPLDSLHIYHSAFVFDSGRNVFWIGTNGGGFCLDLKTKTLFSAANNPAGNPFFTKDVILSLTLDKDRNLWYSNVTATQLCFYNLATKELQTLDNINGNPEWNFKGGAPVLQFDREGRLWMCTWSYTAYIRYANGTFEQLTYNPNVPYSIGYGFFSDAFIDKYNNVWLATLNGVSKLEKTAFVQSIVQAPSYKFYLPTGFANINSVQLDGEDWWLGKMDALVHYDAAAKTFRHFSVSSTALSKNEIFDLQVTGNSIWCATNAGIQILDKGKETFHPLHHTADGDDYGSHISAIFKDSRENVWSCIWQKALCRYDLQTKTCVHFSADAAIKQTRCLYEASNKNIWIGTRNGVRIWNAATGTFTVAAPVIQETVSVMTEDSQQNVWVATVGHGLIKCTPNGTVIDSVNKIHGLPVAWITDMVIDSLNRLWIISREGLFCISPVTKAITKVSIPVTYSFNDHWNSLKKSGDLIYASMLDNVVVINTARYQMLPAALPPLISSFSVFGTETPLSPTVELSYRQNFFSVDFASPFHAEASAMQYAYKLQHFDKDWVYCGRNLTASYTNVPDGDYTFLVKSTGANGEWMKEMTSVNITVKPPFWKTWWFIGLIAIAVAFAVYYLYRLRQKQKQEKQMDETIDYFANSFYSDNSISEICWDIARNCISQLKLEDCVVYLLDEKRNVLVQKAAYGPKNPKDHEIINPIDLQIGEGIVGTAAATGKSIISKDTTKDSRYVVDDKSRLSEIAVPIIHDGKAIGVIDSEHSHRNYFTDEHLKVLSTIAAITANKIAEAKAEEAARESEIQLLEIKKLLAESQLMALRAQMNPHFVFNCLNSIQECIVTQKYGEASLYLNKFAKLFRSVLNNSGKVFVTLSEEIEVLELYLTLEHMRFEKSFTYSIDTDEELEAEEILVPSMLLQPYVENALWHGLMHKPDNRQLTISFNKKGADVFECIIEDNGIGRKRALELKEQQSKTKRHVSRGMTISKDRIELLQKQGQHAALNIIDKHNNAGEAMGTKVVIELSAFLQ